MSEDSMLSSFVSGAKLEPSWFSLSEYTSFNWSEVQSLIDLKLSQYKKIHPYIKLKTLF